MQTLLSIQQIGINAILCLLQRTAWEGVTFCKDMHASKREVENCPFGYIHCMYVGNVVAKIMWSDDTRLGTGKE